YYKALEYVEGRRTLEIGCGEGVGAGLLASKAASLVAVDYSQDALKVAKSQHDASSVKFVMMKAPPIDFRDASFDAVVCFQMIEHTERPAQIVDEIRRVLRNGGVALIATVNKEEAISNNPYHIHEFSSESFRELLERYFESVETYGVFGDELFMRYWKSNRQWVNTFMRFDVFRLSDRLPEAFKRRLFDVASSLMRASLKRRDPELCRNITHKNFVFHAGRFAGCLDLFAVCRKTASSSCGKTSDENPAAVP
ncbi:MAG: class I SAM-dependent methyltransferase, partial [Candidatus Lindowbacteria bacterium]|nr:class I SAM-dependent methyltransferase [Candidatus Lindowbacteria bacterium]